MPTDYSQRSRSCRAFIVTPYKVDSDGQMQAVMPSSCPVRDEAGEHGECGLARHHVRRRKTGPKHGLLVVSCRSHGIAFTLYPPSYAPYRRQSLTKLAPDGEPIRSAATASDGKADYEGTVFEAAFDAKAGCRWARESGDGQPERWWGTQGRHLRLATLLAGVARDLDAKIRESIAAVLSVGTLLLRELSQAVGYRAIGTSVCSVLGSLHGHASRRAQQLLVCGHLVGQWGAPLHWDAERKALVRSPFSIGGTSPPT
jgi:hypothetical protein